MARLRFGRPISLRWNGLLLQGPASTVFEIPDEYYEEFNQDIGPVEPTLEWLDSDEGATLRGRVTALEGAGTTNLSNDAALALGTAASGTGSEASRDDHVHPTTGLALSGHNHDGSYATTGHNHSGVYEPVNTAILKSVVDAKGDLIVGTAADTVDRLPGSGTNGYVLTYDSAETTGLKWAAAPGSGGGASVGNATPLALGTASAGDDATASREDHVHPTTGLALSGHDHDAAYAPIGDANRADIVFETCKNSSGTTIAKGKVVYIDGSDGTNPTIALADADSEATSSKTLGFTETSSNNGDQVNVITHGRITNIDTSAASTEGVSVWLSGTAGNYVFGTPPAEPAHAVYLGVVTKKNVSTGEIFVKVQNGYELDELHDVSVSSPSAGDIIQWATDGSNYMWRKKSLTDAGAALSGHNHSGVYETAGAVSTHEAAGDPHTQYLTETAAASTYSTTSHNHSGVYANSSHTHAQSDVTNLTTDLSAKAPTASPTFTGTVTTPLTTAGVVKTSAVGVLSSVSAINQSESHGTPDTDSATSSLHHTIGTGANQAAAGNHTHSYLASSGGALTGDITLNAQSDVRFADSDSSNWVALQAPATVSTNVTWTLPSTDGTSGQVLSTNGTGTLSWATAGGSQSLTLNQQTGTTYTLQASDLNKLVEVSNTGAITVTVPANILSVGDQIHIMQTNTGQITVAKGTNVSAVNSALGLKLRTQWSSATLIKRVTSNNADVWVLVGDTVA